MPQHDRRCGSRHDRQPVRRIEVHPAVPREPGQQGHPRHQHGRPAIEARLRGELVGPGHPIHAADRQRGDSRSGRQVILQSADQRTPHLVQTAARRTGHQQDHMIRERIVAGGPGAPPPRRQSQRRHHLPPMPVGAGHSSYENQRLERHVKPPAPVQERKLDQRRRRRHHRAGLPQQGNPGRHGPAGRQQVIENDHPLTRTDRVRLYLQPVAAVFQRVVQPHGRPRQLARLAQHDEPAAQLQRQRCRQQEPAALDAGQQVRMIAPHDARHPSHRHLPGILVP